MKTLLLVRHAKSSWNDSSMTDHQRPLNERGRRSAPWAGTYLREQGLVPERLFSSTAERARTTAEVIAEHSGFAGTVETRDDLYLAASETIVTVLRNEAGTAGRVLVVAHNPGIAELVERLSGRSEAITTANIAHFECPIDDWSDLQLDGSAELVCVWRPREAD